MRDQSAMPRLGFGTYGRTGAEGLEAMLCALEAGYRHLDTAQSYGTEEGVGEAIRRSGLDREAIFITTKIAPENFSEGSLIPSLRTSLGRLGLDAVDLTLIHWPSPRGAVPPPVYMRQLAEAKTLGLTRAIGVSNFTIALIEQTRALIGDGEIATNQIELNPLFQNRKLADHCVAAGITVTCYRPIARGHVSGDPVLSAIAARHGATPEQVALAFELARGYAAIPTSGNAGRIRANFAALDLALDAAEIAEIEWIEQGRRAIDPEWGPDWD